MKKLAFIIGLATLLTSCSCDSRFDKGATKLLKQFDNYAKEGKILYGHQDDLMYGHSWRIDATEKDFESSDVKAVCGKYPAVLGLDLGGIELKNEKNLDQNYFTHMREASIKHVERGGVVTMSWHPRNPLTGGDAWDVSSKEVVASILEGGSKHEYFMSWLSNLADYLLSFKTSKGELIPIIFRPWHEHTGSWFWWGEGLCTVEQYKALWKMTFDYLCNERGLHNLIWSYSPGAGGLTYERMGERYPGNDMVDMVGTDAYHSDDSYPERLASALKIVSDFAKANSKLFALTETGYEGIPQADWWTNVLYPVLNEYKPVYVLTWRNACDMPHHFYAPFPGQVSADDFVKFTQLENIIVL